MVKQVFLSIIFLLMISCFMVRSVDPQREKYRIVFIVETPENPEPERGIYLTGNDPKLGNWKADGFRLSRLDPTHFSGTAELEAGKVLEYKITRGSWESEAIYEDLKVPQNSILKVQKDDTIRVKVRTWKDVLFSAVGGDITGNAEYIRNFKSEFLELPRDIVVWLPPGYNDSKLRYPVLYMHDGQNIFDPATSFLGIDWRVDEVADSLIRLGKMREIIIVGIYNTTNRSTEYSPEDKGKEYGRMLMEEIKPMIDKRYRTLPGRLNTAVMGSSMGGLISLDILLRYPERISMAGCLSPAFLVHNNEIIRRVKRKKDIPEDVRIYLDCGDKDLEEKLLPGTQKVAAILRKKGFVDGKNLLYREFPGETHNESAWAKRVYLPLLFFFGKD